jgi:hypothetical protein
MGHIQTLIRKIMHATKWVTIVSDGRSIKEKLKKFCSGPLHRTIQEKENEGESPSPRGRDTLSEKLACPATQGGYWSLPCTRAIPSCDGEALPQTQSGSKNC